MIVASLAVCALLLTTLGVLTHLALQDSKQLVDVKREVASLDKRITAINAEQASLDADLKKPENSSVLERSVFLNTLLQRKAISWNQIFTDLEKTIPYNVKIVRIHPAVDPQDHVTLEMIVAAESFVPVIQMLKALQESPLFGTAIPRGSTPATATDPLVKYTLSVPYAQKL